MILFDTHILIWTLFAPERLPEALKTAVDSGTDEIAFSAVSVWEIAIKSQIARHGLPATADQVWQEAVAAGLKELPVTSMAAAHVARLPLHHRDPFDRLLVAQAMTEPAHLYTVDRSLAVYSELVRIV